jgi:DNA-binding MarR family transcriptional regulator
LGLLEFLVLARAAEGEGVTPGEARRSLGLGTSTMAGLCDRLEAAALLQRHPHPNDGRLVLLKATARGQALRNRVLEPILAQLSAEAGQLKKGERAIIAQFLQQVVEHINEHADSLSDPTIDADGGPSAPTPRRTSTPRRSRTNRPRKPQSR